MRLIVIFLIVFLSSLILYAQTPTSFNADENISESTRDYSGEYDVYCIFGYWNDNFWIDKELNHLFNRKIFNPSDDFLTTNLWLRISFNNYLRKYFFDTYLNIITNRDMSFRTDFMVLRLMMESVQSFGLVRFGVGLAFNGRIGGENIQNGYHKMFGIRRVDLNYTKSRYTGLGLYLSSKPAIWEAGKIKLLGSVSGTYLTGRGPSFWETGLSVIYNPWMIGQLRLHAGYIRYYQNNDIFDTFFDNGFLWGTVFSLKVFSNFQITTWFTINQYGIDKQNHFGMTFIWGTSRLIPLNIDDIKFP